MAEGKLIFDETTGEIHIKPTPESGNNHLIFGEEFNVYDDWFFPSKDEVVAMRSLGSSNPANFVNSYHWTSSQSITDDDEAWIVNPIWNSSSQTENLKVNTPWDVRAVRTFTAGIGDYSVGDQGPATGWIFYISGTTYYEVSPVNISNGVAWCNDVNVNVIGAQGTAIGTGVTNTAAIINEGFSQSAAELCTAYSITK